MSDERLFDNRHLLTVPLYVSVGGGATESLLDTLVDLDASGAIRDVILVCSGKNTARHVVAVNTLADERGVNFAKHIYQVDGATSESVSKLETYCARFDKAPLIVGVGGGSCIDVVKLVAYKKNLPLFIYPTVLSSDCLASPVSVLEDDGHKIRTRASIPDGIFIDTKITSKAPRELILSGICDLMSNASALLDIELFHEEYKDIQFAQLISNVSISHLLAHKKAAIGKSKYQKTLAQGLILSGLSMDFAGSSVTASGGEHLISHAFDLNGVGNTTHGIQVYIGMLTCNLIREHLNFTTISKKILKLLKGYGLSSNISDYSITQDDLIGAIRTAPSLRPERNTILSYVDKMSDRQLLNILAPLS